MATETSLNQIVKGAPPPDTKVPPVTPLPPLAQASNEAVASIVADSHSNPPTNANLTSKRPSITSGLNPLTALPSSPPQIYLNLLILEASLRSQYLHLLTRRRLNTFFLLLLCGWNLTFTYALFLRTREDGTGLGGSPYWVIETAIRLGFIGGWIAALLVKATGQWERGIRWPRKWLGNTNRGLRGFNLRVAIVKGNFWREMFGHVYSLVPFGILWREVGLGDPSGAGSGGDWHFVETEDGRIVEEDLSRGGNHVMLLLLPKNFSSEFRENWETYRSEYWDRENERRTTLRRKVKAHRRTKAKELGGWKWWTGMWRLSPSHRPSSSKRHQDLEKHPHGHSRRGSTLTEKEMLAKANRRRSIMRSDSTHSRQSSRSSTPHIELLDGVNDGGSGKKERTRRGSSVSSTASARRGLKKERRAGEGGLVVLSPLTAADEEESSPLSKEKKKRRSRPTTPTVGSSEFIKQEPMSI